MDKKCSTCDYATAHNNALFCMGQKGMPHVHEYESCDSWRSKKFITNADRIRTMSDEELADMLYNYTVRVTTRNSMLFGLANKQEMLHWLKQEVEK